MSRLYPSGAHLRIQWEVVANHFDGDTFRAALTLTNLGDTRLPDSGWAIYFNSSRKPDPETVTGGVSIEHVNGDLFKMVPAARFGTLAPGVSREIGYLANLWAVLATDAPNGFFVVYDEGTPHARVETIGEAKVAPFSRPEQMARNRTDDVPLQTPARTFAENESARLLPAAEVGHITPTPLSVSFGSGSFTIDATSAIVHPHELAKEAGMLRAALAELMIEPLQLAATDPSNAISLHIDPALAVPEAALPDAAYHLVVTAGGVTLSGRTPEGVAHGIQTLRQLLPVRAWKNREASLPVPVCDVLDAPRFDYRGLHLDVARNFSDKQTVLDVLDLMALYKLNKLHFHLTDDEGWRVPIDSLPELTEIGSRRGYAPDPTSWLLPSFGSGCDSGTPPGSGHYSRGDFIEILRHASDRHIEVICEIDVPGHARAAIKAMQVRYRRLREAGKNDEAEAYRLTDLNDASRYESVQMWRDNVVCIGLESCYTFIDTVVRDIRRMYTEAGVVMSTLHVGGDEVPKGAWENSPACQAFMREQAMASVGALQEYFFTRLQDILRRHGLSMASWEEVALAGDEQDGGPRPNPKLVASGLHPYVWNNVWGWGREDVAYRLANAGYSIVLCSVTNLYLDLAHEKHPHEPGYYWGGFVGTRKVFEYCPFDIYTTATVDLFGHPLDAAKLAKMDRLSLEGQKRVLGLQGHLWGENLRSRARTEYLLLPRLIAVAERAWAKDPGWTFIQDSAPRLRQMNEDWNAFANRLGQRELPRLDGFLGGVGYRIPVPGALIRDGALLANVSTPGLALRYTLDGTEPTPASPLYLSPVPVPSSARATVAAFSTDGRRSRAVVVTAARGE